MLYFFFVAQKYIVTIIISLIFYPFSHTYTSSYTLSLLQSPLSNVSDSYHFLLNSHLLTLCSLGANILLLSFNFFSAAFRKIDAGGLTDVDERIILGGLTVVDEALW